MTSTFGRVLKYAALALGFVPERKAISGPPVVLNREGFKGLWDKVAKRFDALPLGDVRAEPGEVWFKATGKESGTRSENDWPSVQAAIDGAELRGPLESATIEYEQFTIDSEGKRTRRVIYVHPA